MSRYKNTDSEGNVTWIDYEYTASNPIPLSLKRTRERRANQMAKRKAHNASTRSLPQQTATLTKTTKDL